MILFLIHLANTTVNQNNTNSAGSPNVMDSGLTPTESALSEEENDSS